MEAANLTETSDTPPRETGGNLAAVPAAEAAKPVPENTEAKPSERGGGGGVQCAAQA